MINDTESNELPAKQDAEPSVSPGLSAAAFGSPAIDRYDFDLGGMILEGVLGAIDSLFGKRDAPDTLPNFGAKGVETTQSIVQHFVLPAVCQFVFGELTFAGKGAHRKPILDAKARAELHVSRALVVAALDKHDFAASEAPKTYESIPSSTAEADAARAKAAEDERIKKATPAPGNFIASAVPADSKTTA